MNESRIAIAVFTAVSLALGLGCATPEGLQPTQAWDQAAVTTLAGELVSRVEEAHAEANKESVDADQIQDVSNYLNNLRILERQCKKLHTELKTGKGYSETVWIYDEIKRFYHSVHAGPSWHMIQDELADGHASTSAVLHQLDPYYGKR
jgi:hypothetical protein